MCEPCASPLPYEAVVAAQRGRQMVAPAHRTRAALLLACLLLAAGRVGAARVPSALLAWLPSWLSLPPRFSPKPAPRAPKPWAPGAYPSELRTPPGHTREELVLSARPSSYIAASALPSAFSWADVGGASYLTTQLNQHVPYYCGSCWAHAALSALADRIKIARRGRGLDIGLSVQFLLNCGAGVAGSCHGGSTAGAYNFIQQVGFIPFDTCLAYESCSVDSSEGLCAEPARDYSCSPYNTCRTCSTFAARGGFCSAISVFPNVTVAEYGLVAGEEDMQREIYARGPIACSLNAEPLHDYTGGVLASDAPKTLNHAISLFGWGVDPVDGPYWLGRNSWGEYWGEMGSFRIARGSDTLGVEGHCVWGTPGAFTQLNTPCYEDGTNCVVSGQYEEPARSGVPHGLRALQRAQRFAAAELAEL